MEAPSIAIYQKENDWSYCPLSPSKEPTYHLTTEQIIRCLEKEDREKQEITIYPFKKPVLQINCNTVAGAIEHIGNLSIF